MINHGSLDEQALLAAELKKSRLGLALSIAWILQWVIVGLVAVVFLAWLALREHTQLLIFAIIVAGMGVFCWLFQVLAPKGQDRLGGALFLSSFALMAGICPILFPEIIPTTMVCYVFSTMLSHIILGRRGFVIFIAGCTVCFILNMLYLYSPQPRWFPDLPYFLGPILGTVFGCVSFATLSVFILRIFSGQEGSYAAAFRSAREVEQRAEHEQAQRSQLQQAVSDYVKVMAEVGQGNLSARVPAALNGAGAGGAAENDPLVMLGWELNRTIASLEEMLREIREASNNLSSASGEILAATTQQASGASEQSAAIAQTTTTVDEVKAIGEQAVLRSQEVLEASNRTVAVSRSGQRMVHQAIDSMSLIKVRVENIAENILVLSEQTQQIGDIIATVSEIAEQSNMLALNASIEAARAGEAGKGFAVVAAEVRSLAEQSRRATEQVKAILQEIQKATNTTVMATEEGTKVVDQGVGLAARAEEAIQQLAQVIEESAQRAAQVMAGGRQQSAGVDQIALAMQNINQAMAQSSASTRQAEKAARDLNALAFQLNEMVKRYSL